MDKFAEQTADMIVMRVLLACGILLFTSAAMAREPSKLPASVPPQAANVLRHLSIIPAIQRQSWSKRNQELCLALAIYHEARGAENDQLAIAHVIYNRMKQTGYSVCATVWADGGSQFQWVRHDVTPHELASWRIIQTLALGFMRHPSVDITYGATHFYNAKAVSPAWAHDGHVTMKLHHTFIRMN
jgi:spore germination cell wall hydrolase CwlJ-like protein